MPNVLSPRDLVSKPDNMDETVLHTLFINYSFYLTKEIILIDLEGSQKEVTVTFSFKCMLI